MYRGGSPFVIPRLYILFVLHVLDEEPRKEIVFSSPGLSPGRAIILPPVLAAVSALAKC